MRRVPGWEQQGCALEDNTGELEAGVAFIRQATLEDEQSGDIERNRHGQHSVDREAVPGDVREVAPPPDFMPLAGSPASDLVAVSAVEL